MMRWFSEVEYRCRCGRAGCDAPMELDQALASRLDMLRESLEQPIILTSGIRCATRNAEVGGAPDSRHLIGRAVDIACEDSVERSTLLETIFTRHPEHYPFIELAPKHIHLDIDYREGQFRHRLILGTG